MLADLRYALRSFVKSPAFAIVAILSMALGIGANTAVFSLMDRVLLRQLPVRSPGELVLLTANGPRRGMVETAYDDTYVFSYPMYRDFRDRGPFLNGVVAWYPVDANLSLHASTERVQANIVSGNYFQVLGVASQMGRPLSPQDDTPGAPPVAVLSYALWQQSFGSDPAILNSRINVNKQPVTVVGVAPPQFHGLAVGEEVALFVPFSMVAQMVPHNPSYSLEQRRSHWINLMARLKPGVKRESAEAALNVFWRPILEEEMKAFTRVTPTFQRSWLARHVTLQPAAKGVSMLRMTFGQPLSLLMGLVGLVLLIACANVANLLSARATARRREIAVRLAIGASRWMIVRQILVESVVLSLAGGIVGLLLAAWSGNLLLHLLPADGMAATISADPDLRILGFTALVSLAAGVFFGLLPALQTTNPHIATTLKEQGAAVMGSSSQVRFRKFVVVGQVALSLLLLIGAGLFLRSLRNVKSLDPGYRTDHLISFSIDPVRNGYADPQAIALCDRILARLRTLPGVSSAFFTSTPLLAGQNWDSGVTVPGYIPKDNDNAPNVDVVSPGYFAALGMPLVAGRDFTDADGAQAPHVAVVNQTFAQYYFGRPDVVGRQFFFTGDTKTPVEIVGVAHDSKYADLREGSQRFVWCPYAQRFQRSGRFYVRTIQNPETLAGAMRQAVRDIDSNLPIMNVKTLDQQIDDSVFADRIVSSLSAAFGLLATLLAAIGLYGVMAFSVARRTREIGIRMALGASRRSVLSMVLGEVGILAGIGIAIAIPASFPLTTLARSMMYHVTPHDPVVIVAAAAALALTALLAGYIPAARATRIDPLTALRND